MKIASLALLLLPTFSGYAASIDEVTESQPACYEREYSEQHMQSHPAQTVKKLRLKFYKNEYYSEDSLGLDVKALIKRTVEKTNFLGKKVKRVVYRPFANSMFCQVQGERLRCGIDCDGGSATIQWDIATKDREILMINKGFVLHGGCGEEEGETIWLTPTKGGDDVFKLYALPQHQCQ